jgi:hypothetical protein
MEKISDKYNSSDLISVPAYSEIGKFIEIIKIQ